MRLLEGFVRRVLNVDHELTALDYFEAWEKLTPGEREAFLRADEAEGPHERFVNAVCARGPFGLFE